MYSLHFISVIYYSCRRIERVKKEGRERGRERETEREREKKREERRGREE
jgi:hypothetical protein